MLVTNFYLGCLPGAVDTQPSSVPGNCSLPSECSPSTGLTTARLSPVSPLTDHLLGTGLCVAGEGHLSLSITGTMASRLLDNLAAQNLHSGATGGAAGLLLPSYELTVYITMELSKRTALTLSYRPLLSGGSPASRWDPSHTPSLRSVCEQLETSQTCCEAVSALHWVRIEFLGLHFILTFFINGISISW